jgi:hypothetical protein
MSTGPRGGSGRLPDRQGWRGAGGTAGDGGAARRGGGGGGQLGRVGGGGMELTQGGLRRWIRRRRRLQSRGGMGRRRGQSRRVVRQGRRWPRTVVEVDNGLKLLFTLSSFSPRFN